MAADCRQPAAAPRMIVGLLLTLLGALLFLRGFHIQAAHEVLHWFAPAGFLLVGAALLIRPGCVGHRFWGGMALAVGAFLTADRLGVPLPGDVWDFFWPALLIAGGAMLVRRSFRAPAVAAFDAVTGATPPAASPDNTAMVSHTSVFSGQEIRNTSAAFAGGTLTAVFGGCRLDLTGARTVPGGAILDVATVFGGIVIRVPAGWEIRYNVTPVLGGIYDKTARTSGTAAAGLLTIRGAAIMGAVEVLN